MKPMIIYASYTGTTRGIAEQVHRACGGDIAAVMSRDFLSRAIAFMGRHAPGVKQGDAGIVPEKTDLSGYDLLVIGTPVWGGKPVPAVRNAIAGLTGCSGKPAVIFATCGEKPGATLAVLAEDLAAKGMTVAGQFPFSRKEIEEGSKLNTLIAAVQNRGNLP